LHQIYLDDITGLDEPDNSNSIKIYPNPVKNLIYIEHDISTGLHFTVYNSVGQLVKTGIVYNQIDVSTLHRGFYFLKLTDNTGKSFTSRFIKH
jgi:hypothetical protein